MQQIAVVSGKGGTGKTLLTALWSTFADQPIMADADVTASNLPLLFSHETEASHDYYGMPVAVVDQEECQHCGVCADACRFDAFRVTVGQDGITYYEVDPLSCEGCTLCTLVCPQSGIRMEPHRAGEWFVSSTSLGPLVHGQLAVGEGNTGKLVTELRRAAEDIAEDQYREYLLIDGPPGIGCQTIAAISGVDLAIVVTEPTVSGVHDMGRMLEVTKRLGLPSAVVINKVDLAPQMAETIAAAAAAHDADVIGKLPFLEEIPFALAAGTLTSSPPEALRSAAEAAWNAACSRF